MIAIVTMDYNEALSFLPIFDINDKGPVENRPFAVDTRNPQPG